MNAPCTSNILIKKIFAHTDYPEHLNPFGSDDDDDDEEEVQKEISPPSRPPPPKTSPKRPPPPTRPTSAPSKLDGKSSCFGILLQLSLIVHSINDLYYMNGM